MSSTFDRVSSQYAEKSLVQNKASKKLIDMLNIVNNESILDVACGPGNITAALKRMTKGRVAGVDISAGMIAKAREAIPSVEFNISAAEDIAFEEEFDVVFCNSALQWFTDAERVMRAVNRALKPGGRIGVACPGTAEWTPAFNKAVAVVSEMPGIKPIFKRWKNPWFILPKQSDYKTLFEKCGFKTNHISVDYEATEFSVEEAYGVYLSGAANGFTAKQYYEGKIEDAYVKLFNEKVKEEFEKASTNGKFTLDFNRLYYIGERR